MLKIRCTDIQNPTTENSYSTEYQKAKFHSPYVLNEERNHVWYNSVNKIPAILLSRQNRILPLCLILYFQKERRKMQKLQKKHLQKYLHLHLQLHPHWRQLSGRHCNLRCDALSSIYTVLRSVQTALRSIQDLMLINT